MTARFFLILIFMLSVNSKVLPKKKEESKIPELVTSGKGIWVNYWNYPKDPEAFVAKMKSFDLNTIYLQVNRSNTEVLKHQLATDKILKAAHQNNIKVIGWSYCYLRDINKDVEHFVKPALYQSSDGEKFDGMAADIEENTALAAVKSYTEKIRAQVGKDYPLIAIVYSPRIRAAYPWEYIGNNWDVLMPMTYWHGIKNKNDETVYNFVKDSIVQIRTLSKNQDVKIHLITDGERTQPKEVAISLKAARDHGVDAGISIYPEHLATNEMLEVMKSH